MKNKDGYSNDENLNVHRYMYHSDNNLDSRQTATTTTEPVATSKWVINMSNTPLIEVQKQLLAHGPNFTISQGRPPIGEYFTAVEQTCQSLDQWETEELHVEVKSYKEDSTPYTKHH